MKRVTTIAIGARPSASVLRRALATKAGASSLDKAPAAESATRPAETSPGAASPAAASNAGAEGIVGEGAIDWSRSFHGLSTASFSSEACAALLAPLAAEDIEIKPDGLLYLPEIKYRRILNRAFGPGGWGLAPRSETFVSAGNVSREYALVVQGRLVSIARGEQEYFPSKDAAPADGNGSGGGKNQDGIPTATEGAKSNALMRCCKDLGIASELWDPAFIRRWKKEHAREEFVEHQGTKRKRKLWRRKDVSWEYPYKVATFS